jgi:metal-responsive CopG/Arc/MetJ family transcriptional regulator
MGNIELRMPDSLVKKLDIVGAVDELTRGEVIRQAVREWIEELDWKWYVKEYGKLEEAEPEEKEDEPDAVDEGEEGNADKEEGDED